MEDESFFNYSIGDTSYAAINNGYMEHEPLFTEELNATQETMEMCQGNIPCIFDTTVTGNPDIGMSTMDVSMSNNDTIMALSEYKTIGAEAETHCTMPLQIIPHQR